MDIVIIYNFTIERTLILPQISLLHLSFNNFDGVFYAVINLTLNCILNRNQCLIHTDKLFTLFNLIISLQVSTEIRVALNPPPLLTSAICSCK